MAKRGPKRKINSETLEGKINNYFDSFPKSKFRPTKAGLALAIGYIDKHSIQDAIDRNDELSPLVKKAVKRIEEAHEANLYNKNCTGSIFWLKNAGWKDTSEHTNTIKVDDLDKILEVIRGSSNPKLPQQN